MKHDRVNYLVVGLFVVAMLVLLFVLLAMVTGRTGPTDLYYARFDNVSGLDVGTDVTYEGFRIGRVEGMESIRDGDGPRYRVAFSVYSGWKIPRDSVARIFAAGLLAAFSIDIREGSSSEYLGPGDEITGEAYPDMFTAVAGAADEARVLLIRLQDSAAELNKLLGGDNREHIGSAIRRFDESLGRVNSLLADVNLLVQDNRQEFGSAIADLRQSMGTVNEHVDEISENLEITSRNMREFSRQIRNNPGILLRGRPVPEEDMGATP